MGAVQSAPEGGSLLPCGRYLLASLTGTKEGSNGLKVFLAKPTPTRFPTNSLHTSIGNTLSHYIPSVFHPCGKLLALSRGALGSYKHISSYEKYAI